MGCIQSKLHNKDNNLRPRPRPRRRRRLRCWCNPHPSSSSSTNPADSSVILNSHQHHILTGEPVGSILVPSANLALIYSSLTQRGHYPDSPDRLNQDSLLIVPCLQSNPNLHLFAVFDGHGLFGTECASFARQSLAQILSADPNLPLNPSASFAAAFDSTNALLHASDIDDSMSGTTAVAVLVSGASLFVANVGDSRAVAGVWDAGRNCVVAEDLSCDQTPFRRDEYERVKMCGARVLSVDQVEGIKDPEVQSWGDEETDDGDPPRLWVQNGMYPGTAFTRSLGDLTAEGIGVMAVPEMKVVTITPEHKFFVVASDGVFEFLSSQTVVNMVASFKDPRDACAAIAAESYKIWLEHESRTDDITIIVVHIKDFSNLNSSAADEVRQISSRTSLVASQTAHKETYAHQASGSCHTRRGSSIVELSDLSDLTMEQSPGCVAPSTEQAMLRNVTNPG